MPYKELWWLSTAAPSLVKGCNPKDIFNIVNELINDKKALEKQITKSQEIINQFKTEQSGEIASSVLLHHL